MTANDLFTLIGVALGVLALLGIAVHLWAACARSGQIDDDQMGATDE